MAAGWTNRLRPQGSNDNVNKLTLQLNFLIFNGDSVGGDQGLACFCVWLGIHNDWQGINHDKERISLIRS